MKRTLLALVALSRSVHLLAQLHTAATMLRINTDKENLKIANKSLEFVKIIRENLRRNNDDYALLERQKLVTSRPKSATTGAHPRHVTPVPPVSRLVNRNRIMPSVRPPAQPIATIHPPPPKRRAQLGEITRQSQSSSLPARAPGSSRGPLPLGQPPKMSNNVRRSFNIMSELVVAPNDTQFRSYTRSKHYKKVRIDKLKRLVDKEKNRMREKGWIGMDNTPAATPPATTMLSPRPSLPLRQQHTQDTPPTLESPSPAIMPLTTTRRLPGNKPTNFEQQQQQAALRQSSGSQSPSPDQLDMAHARGQQITLFRFKGRLCQRNLMNIEGPAYDKLGKVVMPAHDPKQFRREFHQTRIPMLLLPRCCNCCKKSVLGCQ